MQVSTINMFLILYWEANYARINNVVISLFDNL